MKRRGGGRVAGRRGCAGRPGGRGRRAAAGRAGATPRPATAAPNRNAAQAQALLEALAAAGVRELCLSPGSRSAPLAAAAAQVPGLRVRVHLDERAAAFFALGLARATRAPVALACTSGTAAANYLPAVVEASLGRVPLLVLTADRPPELRDWGAAQTIDQTRLFGSHVRWFAELPPPEPSAALLRHARAVAARAVAAACADPAGPVHLNLPYREPLEPARVEADVRALAAIDDPVARGASPGATHFRVETPRLAPREALVERLAAELRARRAVLAAGPQDGDPALPAALARLARAARAPLLADGASQLRVGPHVAGAPVLGAYDAFLRHAPFAARHGPEVVLRFGPPLTSRAAERWLERHPGAALRIVDAAGGFRDPAHRAAEILRVDAVALCEALAARLETSWAEATTSPGNARARAERLAAPRDPAPREAPPGAVPEAWLGGFLRAERLAQRALARAIADEPALFAPRAVRALAAALPEDALLYVSNSMPIRDLDLFLPPGPQRLRVLVNRGANGIDGVSSSALGAAAGSERPVALLTGDLAFLHDVGGLLAAARHELSLLCVVVNDDGGGIFSQLPIAAYGASVHFEERFATPHGVDLAAATALAGGTHARVRSPGELELALKAAACARGLRVVEVAVDRAAQTAHRRALLDAVAAALAAEGGR